VINILPVFSLSISEFYVESPYSFEGMSLRELRDTAVKVDGLEKPKRSRDSIDCKMSFLCDIGSARLNSLLIFM